MNETITATMTQEEKIHLIQVFRSERSLYPQQALNIVLEALQLDVLDGGRRFENLYISVM
jgi:hypothetical protein